MGFSDLNKQNLAKSWGLPNSPERQRVLERGSISAQKLAGSSSAELRFGEKFGL